MIARDSIRSWRVGAIAAWQEAWRGDAQVVQEFRFFFFSRGWMVDRWIDLQHVAFLTMPVSDSPVEPEGTGITFARRTRVAIFLSGFGRSEENGTADSDYIFE